METEKKKNCSLDGVERAEEDKKHVLGKKPKVLERAREEEEKPMKTQQAAQATRRNRRARRFFIFLRREEFCSSERLLPSRSLHVTIEFHSLVSVSGYKAKRFNVHFNVFSLSSRKEKEKRKKRERERKYMNESISERDQATNEIDYAIQIILAGSVIKQSIMRLLRTSPEDWFCATRNSKFSYQSPRAINFHFDFISLRFPTPATMYLLFAFYFRSRRTVECQSKSENKSSGCQSDVEQEKKHTNGSGETRTQWIRIMKGGNGSHNRKTLTHNS